MKIKSAIKYQMFELRYGFLIIYAIIYALLIFQIIINGSMDNISVSNTEFSTCGFLLIWGALTMRSYFSFFLQNGISRNTLFVSTVANSAILSAGMALVASLNALFLQLITSQSGFSFQRMYTYFYPDGYTARTFFEGWLFLICVHLFCNMLGFFLSALYYRMNKITKIIVSAGVPALFILGLPLFDFNITHGAIIQGLGKAILFIMGFLNGNCNPYYAVVSFTILAMIFAGLSYLLLRRAMIRK